MNISHKINRYLFLFIFLAGSIHFWGCDGRSIEDGVAERTQPEVLSDEELLDEVQYAPFLISVHTGIFDAGDVIFL